MKVMNTLNEPVSTKVCGFIYSFKPNEVKEIYNMDHFNMFRKKKGEGLAQFEYYGNEALRHQSLEDFEYYQRKTALEAVIKEARQRLFFEVKAEKEMKLDKETTSFDLEDLNISKFKKRVVELERELKSLIESHTKDEEEEGEEVEVNSTKKTKVKKTSKGRGGMTIESTSNADAIAS